MARGLAIKREDIRPGGGCSPAGAAALLESLPLVVDTRNVTRRVGAHANRVVRA